MKKVSCLGCSVTKAIEVKNNSYVDLLNIYLKDQYLFINKGIMGAGLKYIITKYEPSNEDIIMIQIPSFIRQPITKDKNKIDNYLFNNCCLFEKITGMELLKKCDELIKNEIYRLDNFIKNTNKEFILLLYPYYDLEKYYFLLNEQKKYFSIIKEKYKNNNNIKIIEFYDCIYLKNKNMTVDRCASHLNKTGHEFLAKHIIKSIKWQKSFLKI